MRANIRRVLQAWWTGLPATEETCSTDGQTVFSYKTPIAKKRPGMLCVSVRASGSTHTTRTQITAVRLFIQEKGSRLVEMSNL